MPRNGRMSLMNAKNWSITCYPEPNNYSDRELALFRFGSQKLLMVFRRSFFTNNNSAAYIRLGRGVGQRVDPTPEESRQLKHQLALEVVHLLSVFPGAPMTVLEKGAAAYFAKDVGGYDPVETGAPEIYISAYDAVKEFLERFGREAIKELRQSPRGINRISANDIRERYPECPGDLIDRLTSSGGFGASDIQPTTPRFRMTSSQHIYEVRPRKDRRGFDLISDALPFGGLWYTEPNDAVEYAKFFSRSMML